MLLKLLAEAAGIPEVSFMPGGIGGARNGPAHFEAFC